MRPARRHARLGQFCIANQLAAALRGDLKKSLYFRGVDALPLGARMCSVRALIERLLSRRFVPAGPTEPGRRPGRGRLSGPPCAATDTGELRVHRPADELPILAVSQRPLPTASLWLEHQPPRHAPAMIRLLGDPVRYRVEDGPPEPLACLARRYQPLALRQSTEGIEP